MKHTIEEMQFAATVRNLAMELRAKEAKTAIPDAGNAKAELEARSNWAQDRNLDEYIIKAVSLLSDIADTINRL